MDKKWSGIQILAQHLSFEPFGYWTCPVFGSPLYNLTTSSLFQLKTFLITTSSNAFVTSPEKNRCPTSRPRPLPSFSMGIHTDGFQ